MSGKHVVREQDYNIIIPQAAEAKIDTIIPVDDAIHESGKYGKRAYSLLPESCFASSPAAETVPRYPVISFKYRQAVEQLNRCLPCPIRQLNIIGEVTK